MALTDQINHLRLDSLSALDAAHDYYYNTKSVWNLVHEMVRQGRKFTIRNRTTGSATSEGELPGLARQYVTGYLVSATFQQFVSLFENFLFDFIRAWLIEYPGNLSRKQLTFQTVLESADKIDIVRVVVEKEVAELAYHRVDAWFKYLEKIAQLGCPNQEQTERLSEIKASRDVLVHNKGIANSKYSDKSMGRARFNHGERLEIPEHYHQESWQLMKKIISDIAEAAISKLGD